MSCVYTTAVSFSDRLFFILVRRVVYTTGVSFSDRCLFYPGIYWFYPGSPPSELLLVAK